MGKYLTKLKFNWYFSDLNLVRCRIFKVSESECISEKGEKKEGGIIQHFLLDYYVLTINMADIAFWNIKSNINHGTLLNKLKLSEITFSPSVGFLSGWNSLASFLYAWKSIIFLKQVKHMLHYNFKLLKKFLQKYSSKYIKILNWRS